MLNPSSAEGHYWAYARWIFAVINRAITSLRLLRMKIMTCISRLVVCTTLPPTTRAKTAALQIRKQSNSQDYRPPNFGERMLHIATEVVKTKTAPLIVASAFCVNE